MPKFTKSVCSALNIPRAHPAAAAANDTVSRPLAPIPPSLAAYMAPAIIREAAAAEGAKRCAACAPKEARLGGPAVMTAGTGGLRPSKV